MKQVHVSPLREEGKQGCGQRVLRSFSRTVVCVIPACKSDTECHRGDDTGIKRGVLQLKSKTKKSNQLFKGKGGEVLTLVHCCAKEAEIKNGSHSVTLAVWLIGKKNPTNCMCKLLFPSLHTRACAKTLVRAFKGINTFV